LKVDEPLAPDEARPTVVVPLTVAPDAGAVNAAVNVGIGGGGGGGGGAPALLTVTGSVAVAVWPFMVTVAVNVRDPFAVAVVSHVYQSVVPVTL
jgi:hypothetical protein